MKEKVWLTRDKGDCGDYGRYAIFVGDRPFRRKLFWFGTSSSSLVEDMCPKMFHQFCNIRLRKGQCVQVKMTHLKHGFKFEVVK